MKVWESENGETWVEYDQEYNRFFLHSSIIDVMSLPSNGVYKTLRSAKAAYTKVIKSITE